MRRIYVLLKDHLFVEAEPGHARSEVELLTDEQAKAANELQPKDGPWRWHVMDTRAFEMLNPPTEEVVVMKPANEMAWKDPAATVAASGDRRSTAWATVLGGEKVRCKSYDFEDLKWFDTTLQLDAEGRVEANDDENGWAWNPSADDLLDPKQFKF